MTITAGERVPDVQVHIMTDEGPRLVRVLDVLGTGKAVLFAVPGAFTPTCTDYHLPGFIMRADELHAKGVETIACIAVNDAFVMSAWGAGCGVGDALVMLADGNAEFTKAMGLELDGTSFGLGTRSQRYAAVIEDGIVTALQVEEGPGVDRSSADAVLGLL